MARYATLTVVTVEEFGAQVRQRRETRRMSRRDLAQRSGVSPGAIDKLEGRDPPRPRRATAIDLALALDWDLTDALALLDYEPLTTGEQTELARINDPRAQLDRMWDELSPSQRVALVNLVSTILNPQALPTEGGAAPTREGTEDLPGNPTRGVHVQDVTPGSGTVLNPQQREKHPNGS